MCEGKCERAHCRDRASPDCESIMGGHVCRLAGPLPWCMEQRCPAVFATNSLCSRAHKMTMT